MVVRLADLTAAAKAVSWADHWVAHLDTRLADLTAAVKDNLKAASMVSQLGPGGKLKMHYRRMFEKDIPYKRSPPRESKYSPHKVEVNTTQTTKLNNILITRKYTPSDPS